MTAVAPSLNRTPVARPARLARAALPMRPARPVREPVGGRLVYWQRRVVVAVLAVVMLVVLVALAGTAAARFGGPADAPARPLAVVHYTVAPGDSLWTIAQHLEPHRDPRQVVDALVTARHSTAVVPGEVIDWAGL